MYHHILTMSVDISDLGICKRLRWDTELPTCIAKLDVLCAVDDSGSTMTWGTKHPIFEREMHTVQEMISSVIYDQILTVSSPMILWSTTARPVTSCRGGMFEKGFTYPHQIFTGDTKTMVENCRVLCLVTDGKISDTYVSEFARKSKTILSAKSLVVGVIVGEERCPYSMNVSVVSALMDLCSNCLIFYDNMSQTRLLLSKGVTLQQQLTELKIVPPIITRTTRWEDLPAVKVWDVLQHLQFSNVQRPLVPFGYILTREHSDFMEVVDLKHLETINAEEILSKWDIIEKWDWENMIDRAKTTNTMGTLRKTVQVLDKRIEEKSVQLAQIERKDVHVTRAAKISQLAAQIALDEFKSATDKRAAVVAYRRLMQDDVNEKACQKAKAKTRVSNPHCFLQGLLSTMTAVEKSDWTVAGRARSNRAQRSSVNEKLDPDELASLISASGAQLYENECQICNLTGPSTLLWISSEDDSFYETDYAIDNPLACGYQASSKICNFYLCLQCATYFMRQGKDMYRRQVQGMFPVFRDSATVPANLWKQLLISASHAFTNGKHMTHVSMLVFAAVEGLDARAWGRTPTWQIVRRLILNYLISQIRTTPEFGQTGTKIAMLDAVLTGCQATDSFVTKPLAMQKLLLKMVHTYHPHVSSEQRNIWARKMLLFSVTRRFRDMKDVDSFTQWLQEYTYATKGSMIVRGTLQGVSVSDAKLWNRLFGDSAPVVRGIFKNLECTVGIRLDTLLAPHVWVYLLHSVCWLHRENNQLLRQRLENMVIQLLLNDSILAHIFLGESTMPEPDILNTMDTRWTGGYRLPILNLPTPDFYLNLGKYSCPDPLRCSDGYYFLPSGTYTILEAERVVRSRRKSKFEELFGSVYPNSHSAHVPVHSIVASVLSDPDEKHDMESVIQQVKGTKGQRGDIYHPRACPTIAYVVQSFNAIRNDTDYSIDNERLCRSLVYKIACALHKRGVICQSPEWFVGSNVKFYFQTE